MQKHFCDLREVDDLADGEQALPEPGVTHDLRMMENRTVDTEVGCVFCDGGTLFARTSAGETYPVTGEGSYVLVPRGL
ncbi:MAG: hypothetical protein AAFP90_08315 [Planctomycetota bacterium]